MNILLIEPDKLLADIYRQALEGAEHSVRMTASAQSAVFSADEIRPDVIVLELQLINHSGLEFLYELRSYPEWQDIPVIINSYVPAGEFAGSWRLLKRQLNIAAYHYKPLTSLQTLLRSIANTQVSMLNVQ